MNICVTGASSGFGEAITRRFVKEGHRVIAIARRKERLEKLKEELGEACWIIPCDISQYEQIQRLLSEVNKEFAPIDILVNNAGLALGLQKAYECDFRDWEIMIETNVKALCFLTRLILPQMVERKRGHIIMLGSIAGTYPYPGGNVYGATKAFVRQFALNLRADLAGSGVRVSDIEPGLAAESEFSLVRFKGDKQKVEELYKNANALIPEDIAEAVYWVANLPAHININTLEVMPTSQSFAPLNVWKQSP